MKGVMITIKPDGSKSEKAFDRPPTLEELQKEVGGYLEVIPHFHTYQKRRCVAYCDEEGKMKGKPVNARATLDWAGASPVNSLGDVLVGNVVVLMGDKEFMDAQ